MPVFCIILEMNVLEKLRMRQGSKMPVSSETLPMIRGYEKILRVIFGYQHFIFLEQNPSGYGRIYQHSERIPPYLSDGRRRLPTRHAMRGIRPE